MPLLAYPLTRRECKALLALAPPVRLVRGSGQGGGLQLPFLERLVGLRLWP